MLGTTSGQTQTQTNTQTAVQGQSQSTSTSSTSYGTSASGSSADSSNASLNAGSQNINFNTYTPSSTTAKITNVPNVYAPGLAAAGSEVCLGSISAGGSGAGFGLTLGGTIVDRECQLRLNARTLAVLGYPVAARETMCLDPDVRQAMLAAGTPCAGDRYAYAPSGAYRRADVADPRNSNAAAPVQVEPVQPVQSEPRQTVSAPVATFAPTPSATPGLQPGCRKEWQLFSGWYITCDGQGAAYQQTAETDPEQSEPPVQQAVRPKSAAAAKPAQTDHRKSVAVAKPPQADQQKPTTAAKPAKSDPWKAMDPDADAVQAAQPKPTAAAKPAKSDPWKAARS